MNTELRNHWATLCLIPYKVKPEVRNKFVACLVGDELADDKEFGEMAENGVIALPGEGCHWLYGRSCFHPFRPGSMIDAIFTSVFRGDRNAEPLVSKEAEEILDCRKCQVCSMGVSKWTLLESAFRGLGRMYDEMLENVEKHGTLYGYTWDEFRGRYSSMIDKVPFFECGPLKEYEGNIRAHFDRLARKHYEALKFVVENGPYDKREEKIAGELRNVRFELVMHFSNYWEKELYKKEEA